VHDALPPGGRKWVKGSRCFSVDVEWRPLWPCYLCWASDS